MMALNFDEIIALSKYLSENDGVKIHLHDACGGQYFTLDKKSEKTINLLKDYFKQNKIVAHFSNNFDSFTIGGLKNV
ncbi:MAG: hypothetical protein RRZ68_01590 [Oscillospiraceae bacterium]